MKTVTIQYFRKNLLIVLFSAFTLSANAQQFITKNGKVHFHSHAALEDIEAVSTQAICALNTETNKIYTKIPITSFVFTNSLMQEHFNENYLESDKIPYATLDATIKENVDYLKDGEYNITLAGTLEIHAVKKQYEIPAKLIIKNSAPIIGTADFSVALADHKIKIPRLVIANIAEIVKVDVNFSFEKYEKK